MRRPDTDDLWTKIETLQRVSYIIFAINNGQMVVVWKMIFIHSTCYKRSRWCWNSVVRCSTVHVHFVNPTGRYHERCIVNIRRLIRIHLVRTCKWTGERCRFVKLGTVSVMMLVAQKSWVPRSILLLLGQCVVRRDRSTCCNHVRSNCKSSVRVVAAGVAATSIGII